MMTDHLLFLAGKIFIMEINLVAVEEKHYCTKKKCLILGPK